MRRDLAASITHCREGVRIEHLKPLGQRIFLDRLAIDQVYKVDYLPW